MEGVRSGRAASDLADPTGAAQAQEGGEGRSENPAAPGTVVAASYRDPEGAETPDRQATLSIPEHPQPATADVGEHHQCVDRKSTRLNSVTNAHLVCRLLLEKKKQKTYTTNLQ